MDRRRPVVFSVVVIGAMLVASAWAWLQLPADAQIAIHWGADGVPNGYASKTVGLFLLPVLTIVVAAVFWALPLIEPRRSNFQKSGKAYSAIWPATVLLLAAIQVVIIAIALGSQVDITLVVFIGVGALFIVIGNYLPKVRSNYLMGIRTPWTLTSDLSWDRTHRLGGRLFVIEGIVFIVFGFVRPSPEALMVILLGGILGMVAFLFAYSYRVWKLDPAKRQA